MTIRGCKVVFKEANEHTTKRVSLRETEETANERRGCCLARTRRALLLLLKAIGASLEAILSGDCCGMRIERRCDRGHRSRQESDSSVAHRSASRPIRSRRFTLLNYEYSNYLFKYHNATCSTTVHTA